MADLQPLPPGWDCRFDRKAGKYYYINHTTKTTTWEDPRLIKTRASEYIPLQDFNHFAKSSPKSAHFQDSSIKTVANTDEAVTKISATFPTVSDTHIRLLLKKYMKSIFPKAEELLILDLLTGNDNNIQKVSEALKEMGFERRDSTPKIKAVEVESKPVDEPEIKAVVTQVLKSLEEKKQMVSQLQEKYKDIPEQVVTIALESAEYDDNRAHHILNVMLQEESCKIDNGDAQQESPDAECASQTASSVSKSQSRQSLKSLLKTDKSDYSLKDACSFSRVIEAEEINGMGENGYRSPNITSTNGANRNIVKGANHDLLLEEYINWQGPQPSLHEGAKISLAKGPNPSLLCTRSYQACGPNSNMCKGPKLGLARGSLFSQFKGVINGTEVRGK